MSEETKSAKVSDDELAQELAEMLEVAGIPEPAQKEEEGSGDVSDDAAASEGDELGGEGEDTEEEQEEESSDEEVDGVEEEEEEEATDELTELRAMVRELTQTVKELTAKQQEKKAEEEDEDRPSDTIDFLGDREIDDVLADKEEFNALLNKIYQAGQEAVMQKIPKIIEANITYTTSMKEATDRFYKENEDLVPWKKTVAAVAMEILDEDPSLNRNLGELLNRVGKEVRERLGLKKSAGESTKTTKRKKTSGFAKPSSSARRTEKTKSEEDEFNPTEAEIMEMNKALMRA